MRESTIKSSITLHISTSSAWMSLAVQIPWVESAKFYDGLHSSSYSLEAMNIVVAPMTCATCFWMLGFFAMKLSNKTTAKWYVFHQNKKLHLF